MANFKLGGKVNAIDTSPVKVRSMRYKGTFDWVYFYQGIQKYFINRRYEFNENRFKDVGKSIKLDLQAHRKIDEWLSADYKLKFILYNLKRKKFKVKGQTRELFSGMIEVEVSGSYKMDSNSIFNKKGKFLNLLGRLFILAKTRDWEVGVQDSVDYGVRNIMTEMRRLLNSWTKEAHDWGITIA